MGSDSKAGDIRRFPPFAGLEAPQENVRLGEFLADGYLKSR